MEVISLALLQDFAIQGTVCRSSNLLVLQQQYLLKELAVVQRQSVFPAAQCVIKLAPALCR
jgi:hypothetical protein